RRGDAADRAFWKQSIEEDQTEDARLEKAIGLLRKHHALEDTVERARHYGSMARDALDIFPASDMKTAMTDVVDFCINRVS
ncbi:MAG: polyprenyl synthetase family protein, partial [Beijerinckiaceae bacterium]